MKPARRVAALGLASALGACALGPNYKPPTPPAGATAPFVAASPVTMSTGAAPDAWWQLYDDSTLDALIAQAFAANVDLQTAEDNLAASRAIYEGARAQLLPQTTTGAAGVYGRDPTTDEILELTGRKPQTTWLFDSMIDASYELDLFGHVRRSIEAARDNTEAVAAARDDLRVTIAAETARAYGQICTLGEQINVANESLSLAQQQLNIVQSRFDAGAGSQYDVVRAQVVVANAQAALPPLQGEREAALFELAALLGETPQNAPVAVESCVQPPRLDAPMPVGDGAALLQRRPDIREADRQLAAALANVGVATADLFPRVTLNGFYGGAATQINMLGSNNGLIWGVGPAISWSFPNMAGPLAQLAQAHANAAGALSNFDSVVLQALKETEQALAVYGAELNHHAALVAAQAEAQQEYQLAQNDYGAGGISTLDLLASEQTLTDANAAVADSDAALVQDQISVFKALGGGWQPSPLASGSGQPGSKGPAIGGG
jgi:NodT family efflux transporter outer membrane factor (OMF) lipoprotein